MHRVASLAKRWLLGTHQGSVDEAHLQAYLDEFVFRFNRRTSRSRGLVFYRVLALAVGHEPVRYNDIRATTKPRNRPPRQRGTGHPPSLDRPAADRPWRTSEMQLQFPLRLSGYPGAGFRCTGLAGDGCADVPEPRRTRAGVSRPAGAGHSQGRRRSAASARARQSWAQAAMISQVHRSAAAGSRILGAAQPRTCLKNLNVCSRSKTDCIRRRIVPESSSCPRN